MRNGSPRHSCFKEKRTSFSSSSVLALALPSSLRRRNSLGALLISGLRITGLKAFQASDVNKWRLVRTVTLKRAIAHDTSLKRSVTTKGPLWRARNFWHWHHLPSSFQSSVSRVVQYIRLAVNCRWLCSGPGMPTCGAELCDGLPQRGKHVWAREETT